MIGATSLALVRGRPILALAGLAWMFLISFIFAVRANAMQPVCGFHSREIAALTIARAGLLCTDEPVGGTCSLENGETGDGVTVENRRALRPKLIVIGFMGGNVSAGNLVHREALLTRKLQADYPDSIHAAIFANRHGDRALRSVLQLLDQDGDGHLSDEEKRAARIVIFGHSWGASQTITLADRLNRLGIPVLLTVQVDSVQKRNQNDARIPPNVQEAVNFYQTEGMLRGRSLIVASDPTKTMVLGNFESSYRQKPVSCVGYPWYARAFMRPHIMIENDPLVWERIEALILEKVS